MDPLYDPYFHFCCELALETWANGSSITTHNFSYTHSFISELTMVRALQPDSWLKTAHSARNRAPTKAEEQFLCLFMEIDDPASTDQGLSTGRPR